MLETHSRCVHRPCHLLVGTMLREAGSTAAQDATRGDLRIPLPREVRGEGGNIPILSSGKRHLLVPLVSERRAAGSGFLLPLPPAAGTVTGKELPSVPSRESGQSSSGPS